MPVEYSKHSGISEEEAIIITNAKNSAEGIHAEYLYIAQIHGKEKIVWNRKSQTLLMDDNKNRIYDKINIILKNGQEKAYYFEISSFFGKF